MASAAGGVSPRCIGHADLADDSPVGGLASSPENPTPPAPVVNDDMYEDVPMGGMPSCIHRGHGCFPFRLLWTIWCIISLNSVVLGIMKASRPKSENALESLRDIFTVIALVEALLLSVGITPFLTIAADWNPLPPFNSDLSWTLVYNSVSLCCMMVCCTLSLVLIAFYLMYLPAVPMHLRFEEVAKVPIFGLFLVSFALSLVGLAVWAVTRLRLAVGGPSELSTFDAEGRAPFPFLRHVGLSVGRVRSRFVLLVLRAFLLFPVPCHHIRVLDAPAISSNDEQTGSKNQSGLIKRLSRAPG